jgi:hypothetical protein
MSADSNLASCNWETRMQTNELIYAVGQKPPGLAEDGTFDTPAGVRASSIVDARGDILIVDKKTGLLVQDIADEDD